MIYLNLEDSLKIHDTIIEEMQGLSGYNKISLGYLDSALEHIKTMISIQALKINLHI